MFHLEAMFSLNSVEFEPSNKEAHKLYTSNFGEFVKQAQTCVVKSQSQMHNNHPASMIKLTGHIPAHDKIIEKIKSLS